MDERMANVGAAAYSALDAIFSDRPDVNTQPTLKICENFTCSAPIVGTSEAAAALLGE